MSRIVKVKRVAPVIDPAPKPQPSDPIPTPVGRKSRGIPNKCPSCGKKLNPGKGDNIINCKDGVQRCDTCYKNWMKDVWKSDAKTGKVGKQKKHNKFGGPRARFIVRFRRV